jgi:ABC-2 type transport system permease protein
MRNFFTLIKANLFIFLGSLNKAKKGRYITSGFLMLFFLVFFGGSMAIQAIAQSHFFVIESHPSIPEFAIFAGIVTSLTMSLLFGIMRATTNTTAKDADLLLSMPIRKSTVVLSKIITQYFFDAPILIMLLAPTMLATFYFGGIGVLAMIRGLILVLLIPMFSLTISMAFGYLFAIVRERIPGGNLLTTAVMMLIMVVYIGWTTMSTSLYTSIQELGAGGAGKIIDAFWPLRCLTEFVMSGSIFYIFMTLLMIIGPFSLVVILYASGYGRGQYQRKSKNRKLLFAMRSPRAAILSAELKKYFACTLYVFNTAFGPVLMMVFAIAVFVMGPDSVMNGILKGEGVVVLGKEHIAGIFLGIFCFFAAMTLTTASSISMEGKKLWVLKSLPVSTWDIFVTKIYVNLIVYIPAHLIASILVASRLELSFLQAVAFVMLPVFLNVAISGGGLIMNLLFPKMNWRTEAEVIKQSASMMLGLLFGLALTVIPVVLYLLVFMVEGGVYLSAYLSIGIYVLVFVAEVLFLNYPGKKMFDKLAA